MADATRYRTLKDQIKKQEGSQARIQELLEGILKSQQQWEAKWEANEKKVEERVTHVLWRKSPRMAPEVPEILIFLPDSGGTENECDRDVPGG